MRNTLIKKLLFTSLFFLCVGIIYAQDNSGCLSKLQLIKIQKSSIEDIRMFLNNEGWSFDGAKSNQPYIYYEYPLNYNLVLWEKTSYYNGGKLILYNFPGKRNIVIYQSNLTCFKFLLNSFSSTKSKTSIEEDKLVTIFMENYITIEFREYKNDYSSSQYSILVYNSSALFQELQSQKENEEALKKAESENKMKYDDAVASGDKFFELGQFEDAKLKYLIAKEIDFNSALEEKITLTEKKILEQKINGIQKTADLYFNDDKYDQALDSYNSILLLDNPNVYASKQIKQIQEIKNILANRCTTIYSYKDINKDDYLLFKTELINDINSRTNNLNEGFLNFNFKVSFDTLGVNLSSANYIKSSIKNYDTYLSSVAKSLLRPSIESGYFLASKENIELDVKWKTQKISFRSTSKGIFQSDYLNVKTSAIENYIANQNYKFGKFTFEVKNKVINNSSFNDIKLVKYRSAGPESVFYSMLMPGMGTLKVTYGKKGWGRFACFLLSSSIAIGSKLYSDSQYKSYSGATAQTDIDKYYNNANISHKISLISGGISASIYLYDIIWVFSKGVKNRNDSKLISKQLQKGTVIIQNQPITLQ